MPLSIDSNKVKLSIALAKEAILKFLPIREFWFSENAFSYSLDGTVVKTGEVGKLVNAISQEVGQLNAEIRNSKDDFYLRSATETALDAWGEDLKISRNSGETDSDYKARILEIIQREKLTKPAIEAYLKNLTGITVEVFEPWKFLEIYNNRDTKLTPTQVDRVNSRSGKAVRGNFYWQAGVIDIITQGYAEPVRKVAPEVVALGVKTFFTSKLEADGKIIAWPDPALLPHKREYLLEAFKFVRWFISGKEVYSGTYPRSGNREVHTQNELVINKVHSYLDNASPTGEDRHVLFYDLDIFIVSMTLPVPEPGSEIWRWLDGLKSRYDDIGVLPPEMSWERLPEIVSYLPHFWDLPAYEKLSVWDTSFSWDDLAGGTTWDRTLQSIRTGLSWDDAIIIGYFDTYKSEFTRFNSAGELVAKDW